jgi:ELWxxDGT repeat protein
MLRQTVLFTGVDASGRQGLWVSNATAAGTYELTGIRGASAGFDPIDFTVLNGEVLLQGTDGSGHSGLWVTDGTAAGSDELTGIKVPIRGVSSPSCTILILPY